MNIEINLEDVCLDFLKVRKHVYNCNCLFKAADRINVDVRSTENIGGFIKDEYCSWVQYKSGPGGGPSM
jgi:hypothetical protein